MAERTTVRLPEDLLRRAKSKALHEGRTLTSLLEDGLRRVLSDERRETTRLMPRVSQASGGFRPDLDDLSGPISDQGDELEYARRLRDGFR